MQNCMFLCYCQVSAISASVILSTEAHRITNNSYNLFDLRL